MYIRLHIKERYKQLRLSSLLQKNRTQSRIDSYEKINSFFCDSYLN